jgi:hypothetical protein
LQEQINEKTIALQVNAAKLTATELKKMIALYLRDRKQKKIAKGGAKKRLKSNTRTGKTTLEKLNKKYDGLKSIEISDKNIKDFEKVAKKYRLEYALKKDDKTDPATYFVFFKGKDLDMIDFAFKEYLKGSLEKAKDNRPSIKKALKKMAEIIKKNDKKKIKVKDKEQSL